MNGNRPEPESGGPKEKWGQPCGRPHSHRRWAPGGSAYRLMSPKLRAGRNRSVAMSSPGARAGAGSTRGRFRSEDLSLPPGGSETGLSIKASSSSASPESFAEPRPSSGKPTLPTLRPRGLNAPRLGLSEDALALFAPPRGFRHRVEPVPKSLPPRRPFSLCLGRANPRLDVWKMRVPTDSGNSATGRLSTSHLNVSGQEWITQRFTAESASYPRSRWPSSRKRSALSLIKPAASCWS
jgi:hypothetical protein